MGDGEVIRVAAQVSGRVQGVYFRASTRERALELGLVGWVANAPDGSVRLEAEGATEAVQALLGWCERGPELAEVNAVERRELEVRGDETTFRIVR